MPRGKKSPKGNGSGTNGPSKTATRQRSGASRTRHATTTPVAETVVGVETEGVAVGLGPQSGTVAVGVPTAEFQEQLTHVQRQIADITREAKEARSAVQSLRDERERIGKELAELRQQVRAAQEQSLKETRDGYSKVGQELTTTAGRLGETVRHAQQEISEVVRQAREARHELDELRRRVQESWPEPASPPAEAVREPKRRERRAARPAPPRNRLGVTVGHGVVVAEVLPDSPAAAAGVTRGDVIEEVNGTGVVTADQLRDAVQKVDAGEEVALQVFRAGELHEVRAKLAAEKGDDTDENRNRLGVMVGLGVVVAEVLPDSPAAAASLTRGDVIDDLNGTAVRAGEHLRDLVQHMPAGEEVVLRVTRAGEVREVRARLGNGSAG